MILSGIDLALNAILRYSRATLSASVLCSLNFRAGNDVRRLGQTSSFDRDVCALVPTRNLLLLHPRFTISTLPIAHQ